ncbi:glycosyltransferase family 4 protein [Paenibacillus sp. Soil750]|uniref:glycosyltransferase family 4 protein n=1 Tax=Paenibacillus sp. Soil750 TaxID=1736398 RepID=UPI0006FE222B|nr:glycosyltransferase family 4 protein [Paenibacillus sp. Soil750]KRE57654.1 hypothetical protein ASL11_32650 [Paenibacillus sp. Soil750]
MRILWVTAQVLPEVANLIGSKKSNFGGWVTTMLDQLKNEENIEIGVVMCANIEYIVSEKIDEITYYIIPMVKSNKDVSIDSCEKIVELFNPDLIHIEGTEFSIQNRFAKIGGIKNVVSLQGILSGYEPYQYGQLPISDMLFSSKFFELSSAWVMLLKKHFLFNKRIQIEHDTIRNAKNILGRTYWDRAHSYWINKDVGYFSCNRILRKSFYNQNWVYEKCEKHSIFVGNGYAALKGIHFVIEAVNLLKFEYEEIKLYVAGISHESISGKNFKKKLGYAYYIRSLIKKLKLEKYIIFTGELDEINMRDRLLKCNTYVLPSLIENSPNTLGEAMIMGVPCVSSYTGGASQMAKDEDEVLFYRANDPKLLAWQIKRVFESEELANDLSINAKKHAEITHDPKRNLQALLDAYSKILE